MSTLIRWSRFNLVGVMGFAVQMTALYLLNRVWSGRYLATSALAVELAVLHNFAWHLRYTWRDRLAGSSTAAQLLRFHASNGVVSITGNLLLMPLLVETAHLPVLVANGASVLVCSLLNFGLSDLWAFAPKAQMADLSIRD